MTTTDTTTDSKTTYASYKESVAACDAIWRQLMAADAFALCGGIEGWDKLRDAYDVMRAEQNRRLKVWLASI
jgi:hypothetical protein